MKPHLGYAALCATLGACTTVGSAETFTQTNFTFPNSNVQALETRVSGEYSKGSLALPNWSSDLTRLATENALAKSDADLLVNGYIVKQTTCVMSIFCSNRVEVFGTPAKAEVGLQTLR